MIELYTPQPAYKIYAFDRGWRVIRYTTQHLFARTDIAARWWFNQANSVRSWGASHEWYINYWAWVVIVGMWLAGGTQYISAFALAALFIGVQTLILSLWVALSCVTIGVLAAITFSYSRIYQIFFRCPNCHNDMSIPVYICPICTTEHTRLLPSIYGILSHRCKKCETKLPTLGLLGRTKVARICPHCHRPLNAGIGEGSNIHIPVVGGTSAGKTNYIVMATQEFREVYKQRYGYTTSFTDDDHERNFNADQQRLKTGRELAATPDTVPQAYNLKIEIPNTPVPKLVYLYDASGETFTSYEKVSQHEYYKYIDGIVFVIDPFAIPHYLQIHKSEVEPIRQWLRPSNLAIMQAYERMIQMFEASVKIRKRGRYPQPIAVVVTKADALNLENEIGASAAQALMARDPSVRSEADAINQLAREFLCHYQLDNFVRDLESQFSNVRYFSCSALGRLPSAMDSSEFIPIRVLEPFAWLLRRIKVIKPKHQIQTVMLHQPMTMRQRV